MTETHRESKETLTDYLNKDLDEAGGRCSGWERGVRQTNRDRTNEELRVGKTRGLGNIGGGIMEAQVSVERCHWKEGDGYHQSRKPWQVEDLVWSW